MKIGVLMGGVSDERDISLMSGNEVLKYLNKDKYEEVIPIIINSKKDVIEKVNNIDFAFLALHGKFGEDGIIQAVLDTMGILYSGCNVMTSSICMNKNIAKKILKAEGVYTAPWITVKNINEIDYNKLEEIGYPLFIKPNNGGSSINTFFIKNKDDVKKAVLKVLKCDNEVMIEKYIKGYEVSSFILNGEVYPTVGIKPKIGEFFDFESKYKDDGAEEKVIKLEKNIQNRINDMSKKIWNTLECKGYCRVDFIISNNKPYFLEVNTLPGMTSNSIIPKSAKARGISFTELLDKIIEYSI
ncbi:D-alanine--D-alanine ligase [Clostridium sp. Ade.TY]|uniref:D-alanine--D-alanine ligase n=1 Tax=Clostridium sp. Ade.TY TaxID=1391647 RepID=UPI000406CCF8|nr:D-alanine--D-alanine ligase [Clostridium sp. Ade.TY]